MHEHGWIDTLEGGHIVCPGDWIITGVKGENYPCKPDIFAATYEETEDDFSLANVKATNDSLEPARGSNGLGAKALGLLFCQQALCLSGGTSNRCSSKQPTGSRWVGCLVELSRCAAG